MEKIERIKCILNGETPDRPAYGFWTHFPGIDLDAQALSETSYAFYKNLDLDFIKSMPNGMFSIQDWGCTCDFSQIAHGGVARVIDAAVKTPDDWHRLAELDLNRGALGRELQALQSLLSLVKKEAAVIATVFSPITTAYKLSEGKIFHHLRTCPEKVAHGLDVITDTTCRFVRKAVEAGCAGIFLATQMCTAKMMTREDYAAWAKPYDRRVLSAARRQTWFNVLHIHGDDILFDQVADYPVHGYSWHIWETPPAVDHFLNQTERKVIVGGLQRTHITGGELDAVVEDMQKMLRLTGNRRLILAPGCTIRHPCNLDALERIVSDIRGMAPDRW
jgi:uroporphyrinogen decarboxylase